MQFDADLPRAFGDYQHQLFLLDHAGLPLKTVLDQLDLLGADVVPVLRREIAARRPRPNHNRATTSPAAAPYTDADTGTER